MINPIKNNIKYTYLPLLIVFATVFININRFDESFVKACVHVFFQSILSYALILIISKHVFFRSLFAVFLILSVISEVSYGTYLNLGMVMSILSASYSESISFIEFNFTIIAFSLVFFWGVTTLPTPRITVYTKLISVVGLIYLILPAVLSSKEILNSYVYSVHIKSGLARGYSSIYAKAEYWFHEELAWRYPPFRSVRAIVDCVNFLNQSANLNSSWQGVKVEEDAPNILVLGIGESLRANNMGIYGYVRNTTPLLNKKLNEIVSYPDAYSAGTNTWSSIPASLTKSSESPDLSKSIINLAKDAGYKTYWISNHAQSGTWDFSVSALADQADHVEFLSTEEAGSEYDYALFTKLKDVIRQQEENSKILVILHFYGSHMTFSDRYPAEYDVFKGENITLDEYDNSVLYTDFVQNEVIEFVQQVNGEYIFFADHGLGAPGSAVSLKHDVRNNPDIESLRVPLLSSSNLNLDGPVSLFYFECIFSEWSKIRSTDLLDDEYCNNPGKPIRFIDSNLQIQDVVSLN